MDSTQKPALAWLSAGIARLVAGMRHAARHVRVGRAERSLRVCESIALGDRRLLVVVQCDRRRYLIAAAAQSITLIDRLDVSRTPALEDIPPADPFSWKGLH
jgi:flagellar biogenesis protein FliO